MDINHLYNIFLSSTGITTDTRKINPGNLFFALSGENFDGNTFARQALDGGCSFAVIDNREYALDERYILVDNTLKALQELALHHRLQLNIPVIGITGTNGKTTTKELIAQVLSRKYQVLYTQGNLNNHIGVPLTLLRIKKQTEIAIIEMGANHPLEIAFLCHIARPTHGIITNIGKAHLEGFGGFEGVIRTKNELYQFLTEHEGSIFYNAGNPILTSLLQGKEVNKVPYGENSSSSGWSYDACSNPFLTFSFQGIGVIRTKLAGIYNLENALAAIAFGLFFDVRFEDIQLALETYEPSNQRSQIKQTENNLLLMDYYNANPSSMEVALENFSKMDYPLKAVILGDMLELGAESVAEHQKIISRLETMDLSLILLVGQQFYALAEDSQVLYFQDNEAAKSWLLNHPVKNYSILIKGSRGIKLELLTELL